MDMLRAGSTGFKVKYLQRLLNIASRGDHAAGAPLKEDGIFGPLTDAAVRAFQTRRSLWLDGIAGDHTWNALGLSHETEHNQVQLFGQPTTTTCWSAAATMIVGNMSVGPGAAALGPGGGLSGADGNADTFAQGLGWRHLNHSPDISELISLMSRTPVWIAAGGSNWAHAVVLSAIYSDGNRNGEGTMVRIHDPWPVGKGRVYGSFADPISIYDASGTTLVPASLMDVLVP